jgi:hypothetical protein
MSVTPGKDFEKLASRQGDAGLVGEFWMFQRQNKKWWLLPILLTMLLFGLLALFSGTAAAPFIYTLF